ncbi:hypothetical protein; putative membrane protein; putative predicted permease YjgP/YjgQ [Pseudorhizobium banfieldiae]|uniref:Lipopolysaccharide export system permease protein n=1 Tax=Pseudorhizobium banfieldiae TaxID=1125847 RepID=L0NB41_9HYPH|nr:LptF/LptG family permease [Pseudorhizobium banfieldiae]CAD6601864.1 LptF/LptG family permease [arsenite-oxidising bacterium NT-25]CCF18303.1 hypothetical protein; putative membrane protein; putative predicted permease YjgP/YjgQ [Pseudorhizobium banfieldiae]
MIPIGYLLRSTLEITGYYILVTALLCLIYLIEKFAALVAIAVDYDISLDTFFSLMLFTLPTMVDLALPLACLGAIYFWLLNAREKREMLIFASTGVGPALIGLTVLLATTGAVLLSLLFAGFIKPAANYSFRSTQQSAENQVLSKGIPGGAFYSQEGKVLYARSLDNTPLREIRLFGFSGDRLDRVIFSNCASIQVKEGSVNAELCKAHIYMLQTNASAPLAEPRMVKVDAGPSRYQFSMESVFRKIDEGYASELSLSELARRGWIESGEYSQAAFSRLLAALTCLVAGAVAVVCVAFTSAATKVFTFPIACASIMVVAIFNNTIASVYGPLARVPFLLAAGAIGAAIAVFLTIGLVHRNHDRLVTPQMAKT